MRSTLLAAAAVLSLGFSTVAFAAGGGGGSRIAVHACQAGRPQFRARQGDDRGAGLSGSLPLLQQVVAKDPSNADAYNLMGYATRKSGNANGSLQYYQQALAIDPRHIGAHEYIGEAYLMLDRPADAEQHLARLDSLCVFGCSEYRMLKAAVASYKQGKKPTN